MEIPKDFKITKIVLTNFKPFNKPRIKKATLSFKEKVQVITSTNGCGKSLFLSQNNTNLIDSELYSTKGGKVVFVFAGGREFRLESTAKLNSFKILNEADKWEELNGGNTKTAYKSLQEEWFGLTDYIWNIVTKVNDFTRLEKTERRIWLETISQQDFTYGFKVYKAVTQAISDYRGARKLASKELVSIKDKILSTGEIEALASKCDKAHLAIEKMLTANQNTSKGNYKERADKLKESINNSWERIKELKNLTRNCPSHCFTQESLEDLISEIRKQQSEVESHLAVIKKINEDIYQRDKFKIEIGEIANKEEVLIQKAKLDSQLQTSISNRPDFPELYFNTIRSGIVDVPLNSVKNILKEIIEFQSNFKSLTLSLHDDVYKLPHSKEQQERLITTYNEAVTRINTLTAQRDSNNELLSRLTGATKISCRKCGHIQPSIDLGISAEQLQTKIEAANLQLEMLNNGLEETGKEIAEFKMVKSYRVAIKNLIKPLEFVSAPIKVIVKDNINSIGGILQGIGSYIVYLEWVINNLEIQEEIKNYDGILYILDLAETPERKDFFTPGHLENQLAKRRTKIKELNITEKELKAYGRLKKEQKALLDALLVDLGEYLKLRQLQINLNQDTILNEMLSKLKSDTNQKTNILNNAKQAVLQKDLLETKIDEYQGILENLKQIEKAMNPTTGIIADQLVGYAKEFASQLTDIVNQVWTIDLTIHPCEVDAKKGMSYKFPFQVTGDSASKVVDLGAGSTAEKAIFNLAVLLATRAALKVEHLPLHLDEIGLGFDGKHNKELIEFMISLLNNYPAKNVFIIHHDLALRHRLPIHETIVFDDRNVVLPEKYNEGTELVLY